MAAWIKMSLGMELGLGPGDCVRWGPRSPLAIRGRAHKFSAHLYCGQTAGWMKLVLGMEVSRSPGDFVLDGDPVPPPEGGGGPYPISAHFYCGQTAGCIKMPLGRDVGLIPGDFMLNGDPDPLPKKEAQPPNFRPMFIMPKRLNGSRYHFARR